MKWPTITLGNYRHYRGTLYCVTGVSLCSETLQPTVDYYPVDAPEQKWHRPFEMFLETVEVDGKTVPRFVLVTDV